MQFLFSDSMKNLLRHRKRYLLLGVLLFGCALLSGYFLTAAAAAKQYLAAYPVDKVTDPFIDAMRPDILRLDSRSSITQAGVLLVSAAAIFYASSAAAGERIPDTYIMWSLGISKASALLGLTVELITLSALTQLPGYLLGRAASICILRQQVSAGTLPEAILDFTSAGIQDALWLLCSAVLLLLPIAVMAVKIVSSAHPAHEA